MTIEEVQENKSQICESILRSLPEWFGIESATRNYIKDVGSRPMFIATHGGVVAGFLSLTIHNEFTAEIHVMGVKKEFHRNGIGRKLVQFIEAYAGNKGIEYITVKTLSPSRESSQYERTRQFYLALGFKPLEEFKSLWGPSNPCLFMVRLVGSRLYF